MNDLSGASLMRNGQNALATIVERLSELIAVAEALEAPAIQHWLIEAEKAAQQLLVEAGGTTGH